MKVLFELKIFDGIDKCTEKGVGIIGYYFAIFAEAVGDVLISCFQLLMFLVISPIIFVGWLACRRESRVSEDS